MTTSLRIDNARLPGESTTVNLLVRDGLIQSMAGDAIRDPADAVIDASGLTLLPGFVDLCCNLREPGNGQKGNIATETRAAARGGFTTVCASPDTSPVNCSAIWSASPLPAAWPSAMAVTPWPTPASCAVAWPTPAPSTSL